MSADFPAKAMVLAAGLGLRMRPLTDERPKPLIDVAGTTLIDRALDWLDASGVREAAVNSHYCAGQLEAHVAARRRPLIHISHEPVLLETGGGIRKALPFLGPSAFFSLNSDSICQDGAVPALHRLHAAWRDEDMDALLLLHPVTRAIGYEGPGDFFLRPDGRLQRRGERPDAPYAFTGVQLAHPRLFADSPDGPFSLNLLYNRGMTADGTLPRIHGIVHDGHWLHVGDPAGLEQAERWFSP